LTITSMRTFLSLIAANEFKTKIMKAIQTITKKQTLPLTHLLYSTETLRRDNRNRLVYEGLANGLLVVAPTKATIDEAAYIQPTDSYYFHHRDDWAQVPLNNIMMVKEDRTEPGDVPQPKKQQVGSEWNWNHYVTVLPPGSNTATGRLEVMGRMCANINSTITEDNGYRFIKSFVWPKIKLMMPISVLLMLSFSKLMLLAFWLLITEMKRLLALLLTMTLLPSTLKILKREKQS
jgi:hypothetical protein